MTDTEPDPTRQPTAGSTEHPVRRLLGTSRYLILLAVVGSFVASATLMIYGVLRSIGIIAGMLQYVGLGLVVDDAYGKGLIADSIALIDMFLLGTVLFIVASGLYQLFINADVPLPRWLRIRSLDDLKLLLTGVIVVALLVAFLGSAVSWHTEDGTAILALGLGIAAVVIAANMSMRIFASHGRADGGHRD